MLVELAGAELELQHYGAAALHCTEALQLDAHCAAAHVARAKARMMRREYKVGYKGRSITLLGRECKVGGSISLSHVRPLPTFPVPMQNTQQTADQDNL